MPRFTLSLCLVLAAAHSTAFAAARISRSEPTLGQAVKLVALSLSGNALPAGVSAVNLSNVPADSPFWKNVLFVAPGQPRALPRGLSAGEYVVAALRESHAETTRALASLVGKKAVSAEAMAKVMVMAPLLGPDLQSQLDELRARHRTIGEQALDLARRIENSIPVANVAPEIIIREFAHYAPSPPNMGLADIDSLLAKNTLPLVGFAQNLHMLHHVRDRGFTWTIKEKITHHCITRIAILEPGYGLALRQIMEPQVRGKYIKVLGSLIDWEAAVPPKSALPDTSTPRNSFTTYRLNPTAPKFPGRERQDIIFMSKAILIVDDKFGTIARLYNSLADYGVMIIATDTSWSQLVRTAEYGPMLLNRFLMALTESGIDILVLGNDDPTGLASLIIRRTPGTTLAAPPRLERTTLDSDYNVVSHYRLPPTVVVKKAP